MTNSISQRLHRGEQASPPHALASTLAAGLLMFSLSSGAHAADLVIAQVAPMTGPIASYSQELQLGAKVYFENVNASGGIKGQKIKLVTTDDADAPKHTVKLIEKAATTDRPVAFLYLVGPESIEAAFKADIFKKLGTPLVGTNPAASQLRAPMSTHVFHIGQGEDAEYIKMAQQMQTIGVKRVAIVHWDDSATMGEIDYFEREVKRNNVLTITDKVPVVAGSGRLDEAFSRITALSVDAVVSMLPVTETGELLKQMRSKGKSTPVYGASYAESGRLFAVAGEAASRGMTVTQTTPNPYVGTLPVVRDYQSDMKRYAPTDTKLSTLSLEGYLAARVLVDAIRRAPPPVTPSGVRDALERTQQLDIGGLKASLSATDHVAFDYVDIGVVTYGGRLRY